MQFHQKQSMVVKKDEMERYLSEPTVRSDSQTNGALGWWKVDLIIHLSGSDYQIIDMFFLQ